MIILQCYRSQNNNIKCHHLLIRTGLQVEVKLETACTGTAGLNLLSKLQLQTLFIAMDIHGYWVFIGIGYSWVLGMYVYCLPYLPTFAFQLIHNIPNLQS